MQRKLRGPKNKRAEIDLLRYTPLKLASDSRKKTNRPIQNKGITGRKPIIMLGIVRNGHSAETACLV